MMHSLNAEQLARLSSQYSWDLESGATSPSSWAQRIPPTWLELVTNPTASSVRTLWQPASQHLPRFIDYLARSVEGAAVVQMHGVPVLALALPDWDEADSELGPGFCCMGLPTTPSLIDNFCDSYGRVPESLSQLWRVANFITLKEHSVLCSLDDETRGLTETPVILPSDDIEIAGCLQIAVINDQMVTCMTRPPGQSHWNDDLVLQFRRIGETSLSVRRRLDDKLADWTFTRWEADPASSDLAAKG